MKKYISFLLAICLFVCLTGCSIKQVHTEKLRDIDFTVVDETKIPKEFSKIIEKKKETPFKLTYADKGILYIAEGYGKKEITGYSVEVDECYETANAIYIHTNLLGPTKQETSMERVSYPYVVIKMEFIDKNVVFK